MLKHAEEKVCIFSDATPSIRVNSDENIAETLIEELKDETLKE